MAYKEPFPVSVANGGTGDITLTGVLTGNGTSNFTASTVSQYNVVVGGASNLVSSVGPGSAGQVLQSAGNAANPAYSTATYPATATGTGKILRADGTNWAASTATYPDVATGTGKMLRANGTNWVASTATYPDVATSTGTILRADGTNWVASTATYPNTAGTSGNILTSDGTNWNSTAPSGTILFTQVNISSANFKTCVTSPVQIIATPGAGKVIVVLRGIFKLNYGGTNVFTSGGIALLVYTTSLVQTLSASSNFYIAAVDKTYGTTNFAGDVGLIENQSISFTTGTGDPGGNAAGNNTVSIGVFYQIVTVT